MALKKLAFAIAIGFFSALALGAIPGAAQSISHFALWLSGTPVSNSNPLPISGSTNSTIYLGGNPVNGSNPLSISGSTNSTLYLGGVAVSGANPLTTSGVNNSTLYLGGIAVSGTNPLTITGDTNTPTYAAANQSIANTGAGDLFCIAGSGTKTIYIKRLRVSATATSAIVVAVSLIKRSTLDTGGTSANETEVPLDSTNAAPTATVVSYTVSPTAGTAVGAVRSRKIAVGVQGNTATTSEALFDFANYFDQPLVLRGTTQNACVNGTAAGSGGSWAIDAEWTEQ
jgi:hypothetical protein